MKHYLVTLDTLPERDSGETPFVAPLCRDVVTSIMPVDSSTPPVDQNGEGDEEEEDQLMDDNSEGQAPEDSELQVSPPVAQTADNGLVCVWFSSHVSQGSCSTSIFHLQGHIGQDTLSHMIRQDEMVIPRRRRYLFHYHNHNFYDYTSRLRYPAGMFKFRISAESDC